MGDRVTDNIDLVWYVVRKYFKHTTQDKDDLFQIGCLGLMKADEKFDENKGVKFSTYAVTKIWGEIQIYFRDHVYSRSKKKEEFKKNILNLEMVIKRNGNGFGKNITLFDALQDNKDYIKEYEDRETIKYIFSKLEDEDVKFIKYRYIENMKQREVAEKLGKTQLQVSRFERKLLKEIRNRFGDSLSIGI